MSKIDKESINRNEAINIYDDDIVEKGKIIAEETQTKSRQNFLDIINYL